MTYIIAPASEAVENYEMLNQSTSSNFDSVRKNSTSTKYLFESKTEVPASVFNKYQWYSRSEILEELENSEWQ